MEWLPEPPLRGLALGSLIFLGVLVVLIIIVGACCAKRQTCYAINFTAILVVMAYIMWACTYMCQMYPLVFPQYGAEE